MSTNLSGKQTGKVIKSFASHGSFTIFNGKLKKRSSEFIHLPKLKKLEVIEILGADIINNELIIDLPFDYSSTYFDFNTINLNSTVTIENNFYGNLMNVEIAIQTGDVVISYLFEWNDQFIELFNKKKVVFQLKNKNSKDNFQNYEIDGETFLKEGMEPYDQDALRPTAIDDMYLYELQFFYHYKSTFKKMLDKFIGLKHERWLELSWISNLSVQLMILYTNTSQDTERYQFLLKSIGVLKEIDSIHRRACDDQKDVELSFLTIHDHERLKATIELLEFWEFAEPDKKILTKEWIERFKDHNYSFFTEEDFKESIFSHLDYKVWFELPAFSLEHQIYYLLPEQTNYGKKHNAINYNNDVSSISIQSKDGMLAASKFWENYFPTHINRYHVGLTSFDQPCDFEGELDIFLKMFNNGAIDNQTLKDLTSSISTEIEQDATYVLHPDVTFDLRNDLFPTVTINQCSIQQTDYHAVFRNKKNGFFKIIFSTQLGTALLSSHKLAHDDDLMNCSNQLAYYCIMLIRDFMVPINRETIFSHKKRKHSIGKPAYDESIKVIYVPRIKYRVSQSDADLKAVYEENFPFRPKQRHSVRSHFRQLRDGAKPSNGALLLARKYNTLIPKGFTFVKDHQRGGLNEDQKVIYRSRSILKTFYGEKLGNKKTNDWFKFEEDVAILLSKSCKEVINRKATGDGGIDIEALDQDGNIILAQCKCYSPRRKIDRAIIDELYGSITRFKNENELEHVHGMIFTTSSFSKDAIDAAQALEIELVSGLDLQKLMSDEGL